jgi:hypothetical protein
MNLTEKMEANSKPIPDLHDAELYAVRHDTENGPMPMAAVINGQIYAFTPTTSTRPGG